VIGYVPQTINLQEGSLSSNIALGLKNNSIDYDLIKEIVEILELTDLVSNLKNNIHSNIGDRGVKLSGGQRQRLGIARALYLNPKILILDESTNELDSKTESNIFSKIKQKYPFITIIMITHRLSSLKLADNVMLLKDNSMHKVDISDITDIEQLEKTIEACN
jgi:ATP-binding cassette subfamily C protein